MKKYLFFIVLFVSFTIGLFGEIINVPGDFPTIQLAINEALSLTGYVTIEVEEDIYIENLDIDLDSTGLSHLTLVGVDGAESCIINGGNVGNIVDVYYSLYTDKFFKITGFTIKNSITSKGIYAHSGPWVSSALNVEISNNIIQDSRCGIDLYRVSNCVVNDNTIINYSQVEPSWGIKSGYVNNVIINGNFVSNFWDNITFLSSDGKIINNKIDIITYSGESYGISLQASSNIDIIDNLILVNSGETGIYNSSEGNNAKIINNTIIGFGDNTVGYRVYLWGNTEKFVNNIMWNLDHNIYAGETVFEVNYCCYNGTIPPECEPLENHNIYTDPLFTTDYHLSENSPCINAGDPDTDGDGLDWIYDEDDRDIDGSRKDMGCYPFLHNYDTKHFDEGVHWVSFPVLTQQGVYTSPPQPSIPPINNQIFEQAYYENGMSGLLQETSGTTGTINEFVNILGKRYGVDMEIYPEGSNYIGNDFGFDNMLFRHEGYKIVVGEVTNPTTLLVGDEVEDERLPVDHVIAGSMNPGEYHWLGYWLPYPQNMVDAFGFGTQDDFWQYVEKVKSEDWYYNKCSIIRGGDPSTPVTKSATGLTLEYGKTYMVWFKDQPIENFHWHASSTEEEPKKKAESENFTYTEKPDYEAIDVVNIPPDVIEIGVFEEEVCVGAVVVEDSCAQILAYSDYANRDPVPFTFEVVTGRGQSTPIRDYQVLDWETGEFEYRSIISGRQEYSIIRFGDEDEPENNIFSTPQLYGNYPNPFNPTTTIEFSLVQTSQFVTLEIFNIKGQKVKTLYKGIAEEGKHSVIWEGKDTNGKSVSTGIYFYKLKTGKKEISRKMLLLK